MKSPIEDGRKYVPSDILSRLSESSPNEGSHDLYCRCLDAAEEISRLRHEMSKLQGQRDELLAVLMAIAKEVGDGSRPYDTDSHLPPQLKDRIFDVIERVKND